MSEGSTKVFFICSVCHQAAFEIPKYQHERIFHQSCESLAQLQSKNESIVGKIDSLKPVARVYLDGLLICIEHEFDENINKAYQKYYHFRWNRSKYRREVKKDLVTNLIAKFLTEELPRRFSSFSWTYSQDLLAFLKDFIQNVPQKEQIVIPEDCSSFLKIPLLSYQKKGVAFLEQADGVALMGDEFGLGIQFQSIAYAAFRGFKTIIVTTESHKAQWKRNLDTWVFKSSLILEKVSEKIDKLKQYDFLILNYESLPKFEKIIKKLTLDLVIIDQSYLLSSPSTKRTQITQAIFKSFLHRIEISEKDSWKKPLDLYPQLKLLKPEEFPNKLSYGNRYCDPKSGYNEFVEYNGASNIDELKDRTASYYLRRSRQEVESELPLINYLGVGYEQGSKIPKKEESQLSIGLDSPFSKLKKHRQFSEQRIVKTVAHALASIDVKNPKTVVLSSFRRHRFEIANKVSNFGLQLHFKDSKEQKLQSVKRFNIDSTMRILVASSFDSLDVLAEAQAQTLILGDLVAVSRYRDLINKWISQGKKIFVDTSFILGSHEEQVWECFKASSSK